MKNILFVCVENSCRSQMAEAFGKIHGGEKIAIYSSGSRPSGKVNPKAIDSMGEINYNLTTHTSKPLTELPPITFDFVITMGCGDECPSVSATQREDWSIPDPKNLTPSKFSEVRDLIEEKVIHLLNRLK